MISFEQIEFWNWWVIAVFLIGIEVFAPGAVFLWMGIAAGIVGFVLLAIPETTWQIQLLIFAVISVVSIYVWRFFLRGRFAKPENGRVLNRRGASYVGRSFTLKEPIVDGSGLLHVDDTDEIMNEFLTATDLGAGDIEGSQVIYGEAPVPVFEADSGSLVSFFERFFELPRFRGKTDERIED